MALTLVTSDLIHGLDYSKLTGTITTWNQNTTGNADTATLAAGATILATARNIGGVSFNGSAAINLPGVNAAGNQNTSGNAGTVTNGVYTVGNQTIAGVKTFSGNVGIGTSSPSATLHVNAPATTAPSLTMGASAGQIFENEDLEFAFGLNNASPYNGWMQTRFNGNAARNFAINPLGGNVGIGTNSPSAKLHSYINTSTPTILGRFENLGGEGIIEIKSKNTKLSVLQFADSEDGNVGAVQYFHQDNEMQFKTNDSVKLRISSFGEATFGSTTDYKIGLNDSAGTNQWWLKSYTNGSFAIHENTVGDKFTILAGGSVGIGTTIPQYPLQVKSGTNINFSISTGIADNTAVRLNAVNDAVNANIPMEFYATKFNFNLGNVGIGTASPSAKLQIHTTTNAGNPEVAAFLVNKSAATNTEVRLAFAAHTNDVISTGRYSYISAKNTSGSNGQDLVFATNVTGASATPKLTISSAGLATFSNDIELSRAARTTIYASSTNQGVQLKSNGSGVLQLNADGGGNVTIAENGGSVVIGNNPTPSSGCLLTLRTSGSTGLSIKSASNTGESYINFTDNDDENVGQIYYGHSDNRMAFRTNDSERMRILSGGNILIGATNADVGGSVPGISLRNNGSAIFAIDYANPPHYASPMSVDRRNTSGDGNMYTMWRAGIFRAGIGLDSNAMVFNIGNGANSAQTERLRIASNGDATFTRRIYAQTDNGVGATTNRAIYIPHGGAGTFTFDFNPITLFSFSTTGGFVKIEAGGWSHRFRSGYIYFQNAGGGGNLTTVSFYESAGNGSGTISVGFNGTNNIRVTFSNWHSNGHAWYARVSSSR